MPAADAGTGRCPVCLWPVTTGAGACGVCGWHPNGRQAERTAAQARWDLRAAHLAAAGDESIVDKLSDDVRGGRPSHAQIIDAGVRPAVALDAGDALEVLATLLASLVGGELRSVAFLCLRPDGVEVLTAGANGFGVTRMTVLDQLWHWLDLAHDLPVDAAKRHFALAGGVGEPEESLHGAGGPAFDPVATFESIAQALPELTLGHGSAVVVVNGAPGWTLITKIADFMAMHYKAATTLVHPLPDNARSFVESLVRQAPVGRDHKVVLLDPHGEHGHDGRVHLRLGTVFAQGERSSKRVGVDLYAPVGATGRVSVAMVVNEPGTRPAEWQAVDIVDVELPRGHAGRLEIAFDESGDPVYSGLPSRAGRRSWPDLLHSVPRRLSERRIDVVFAVEAVAGPGAAERLALLRDVLAALDNEDGGGQWIRVALLAYGQHHGTGAEERPCDTLALTRPHLARVEAEQLAPRQNWYDFAAAAEEALAATVRQSWRAGAERVLVTLGSRPPYPRVQGPDHARPCVAGHDWQAEIASLDAAGVRRLAVWSDPEWGTVDRVDEPIAGRAEAAWQALGAGGRLELGEASVAGLLDRIGATFVTPETPFPYLAAPLSAPRATFRRSA